MERLLTIMSSSVELHGSGRISCIDFFMVTTRTKAVHIKRKEILILHWFDQCFGVDSKCIYYINFKLYNYNNWY